MKLQIMVCGDLNVNFLLDDSPKQPIQTLITSFNQRVLVNFLHDFKNAEAHIYRCFLHPSCN